MDICFTHGYLSETLFFPIFLRRCFGLTIAPGAEIDRSTWGCPDQTTMEEYSMVNGDTLVNMPVVHNGYMSIGSVHMGKRCFIGNDAVLAMGSSLGDDTLLGVTSCSPETVKAGSTVLGSPAFEVLAREQSGSAIAVYNPTLAVPITTTKKSCAQTLTFDPPCHVYYVRFLAEILIKIMIVPVTIGYVAIFELWLSSKSWQQAMRSPDDHITLADIFAGDENARDVNISEWGG
jgi:hypothetical protein